MNASWVTMVVIVASMSFSASSHAQKAMPSSAASAASAASTASKAKEAAANDHVAESAGTPQKSASESGGLGRPFTAKLSVDSSVPVTYGDDVLISVWITPNEAMDIKEVRIHPKGRLAAIYRSEEQESDAGDDEKEFKAGTPCRTSIRNARKGIPFVANCQLTSISSGWRRWLGWNTVLLGAGRHQVEVEVARLGRVSDVTRYFEFGSIDFVSPKSSVLLGGLFGAFMWIVFLGISPPEATRSVVVPNWEDAISRFKAKLPQAAVNSCLGSWRALRSALLGGMTALVLIVTAKTTEGMGTPIAIQIQDFWGGVVIGILSAPLSTWLKDKFQNMIK